MSDWESAEAGMTRTRVPGGWVYSCLYRESDGDPPLLGMCFVPEPPEKKKPELWNEGEQDRTGMRWTTSEEDHLVVEWNKEPITAERVIALSKAHRRRPGALLSRLRLLGVITEEAEARLRNRVTSRWKQEQRDAKSQ